MGADVLTAGGLTVDAEEVARDDECLCAREGGVDGGAAIAPSCKHTNLGETFFSKLLPGQASLSPSIIWTQVHYETALNNRTQSNQSISSCDESL